MHCPEDTTLHCPEDTTLLRRPLLAATLVQDVATRPLSSSLGAAADGNVTKAQHCRTEVWIDENRGWLPLDPASFRYAIHARELA